MARFLTTILPTTDGCDNAALAVRAAVDLATGTGGDWLDSHFEAARPEYEAQLRAVGIRPGWHVLDAGCGCGSFLPGLAELVGPGGRLAALDLAPDNVALVARRVQGWALPCPIAAQAGTVLALPYPDASFDAAWFADTSQYLTDDELGTALAELRRVVRPGGLVAVKEADPTLDRILPARPGLLLRFMQASAAVGVTRARGVLRAPALPGWLRRAGLVDVWQRATLIERVAPLDPATRAYQRDFLAFFAARAGTCGLAAADRDAWAHFSDPAALDRFLDDPDCALLEGNILTVGTVPTA